MHEVVVVPYETFMSDLQSLIASVSNTGNEPVIQINALDEKMNVEQAAEYLNISVQVLYKRIKEIPCHKKHRQLYFFKSELIEYLKQY